MRWTGAASTNATCWANGSAPPISGRRAYPAPIVVRRHPIDSTRSNQAAASSPTSATGTRPVIVLPSVSTRAGRCTSRSGMPSHISRRPPGIGSGCTRAMAGNLRWVISWPAGPWTCHSRSPSNPYWLTIS